MAFAPLLAALALALQAPAGPADPEATLDQLYDQLAAAEGAGEAERIAGQIALVWTDSGSATVNLLLDRAEQALEAGEPDRAARRLDDALELEPGFAEGWTRRAMVHLAQEEPAAALEAVNRALIADPRHYQALLGLGTVLERMDRPRAAYEAYGEALAVHPYLEEAEDRRARLRPLIEGRAL